MWNSPQAYYLTEVLGLRLGKNLSAAPDQGPVEVAIWSAQEFSDEAQEMVQKMMAAIGVQNFSFFSGDEDVATVAQHSACIAFGESDLNNVKLLCLPPWSDFFSPSEAEKIQDLKKQTWLKLKSFKQKMSV